ncbi:MAG: CPXCG motif-containing cysteine-rich protein [Gammaproteobacteria bacterium]
MNSIETVDIQCPYCGETIEIGVDCSVGNQRYIEDCQVCCRPIEMIVTIDEAGIPVVKVLQEDDTRGFKLEVQQLMMSWCERIPHAVS